MHEDAVGPGPDGPSLSWIGPRPFTPDEASRLSEAARFAAAPLAALTARATLTAALEAYLGRRSAARVLAGPLRRPHCRAVNGVADKAETGTGPSASFQAAVMTAAPGANLKWLFADWIDADHGLPDLTIDKVFPNAVQSGNWLVSVTLSNAGYAAAEVHHGAFSNEYDDRARSHSCPRNGHAPPARAGQTNRGSGE